MDKALIFFLIASAQLAALRSAAREARRRGHLFAEAYRGLRTRPLLSDYTWNHTTLWAMNSRRSVYLSAMRVSIRDRCASNCGC